MKTRLRGGSGVGGVFLIEDDKKNFVDATNIIHRHVEDLQSDIEFDDLVFEVVNVDIDDITIDISNKDLKKNEFVYDEFIVVVGVQEGGSAGEDAQEKIKTEYKKRITRLVLDIVNIPTVQQLNKNKHFVRVTVKGKLNTARDIEEEKRQSDIKKQQQLEQQIEQQKK